MFLGQNSQLITCYNLKYVYIYMTIASFNPRVKS